MEQVLAVGLAWLLLPLPFAVFVGKCIGVGQAGEVARHAADQRPSTAADPVPVVPAQRRPAAAVGHADLVR
jgi:hypothetical protein